MPGSRNIGLGQRQRHRPQLMLARALCFGFLHRPIDEADEPDDRELQREHGEDYEDDRQDADRNSVGDLNLIGF
jgi:hypothetical protein